MQTTAGKEDMEKQKKQFIVVLILLVVAVAAYLILHVYNDKKEAKEEAEEDADTITITDFDADDVTAFSYQLNGETLSFTKDGDNWLYDGDTSLDLDEDSITSMLSAVSNLTTEEALEEYDSLSDYGLDTPSNTITVTTADGTITLLAGNQNEITNSYYMMTGDSDTVYLISTDLNSTFSSAVDDLIAEEEETETEEPEEATETVSEDTTEEAVLEETTETAEVTEAE